MAEQFKKFILKDFSGEKLGEIILFFSKKKFKLKISPREEQEKIALLLNKHLKEGIRNLGEVILEKPVDSTDPQFELLLRRELMKEGYILLPTENK